MCFLKSSQKRQLNISEADSESVSQSVTKAFCQSAESEPSFSVELCTPPVLSVPVGPLGDSFSPVSEGNAVEGLRAMKMGF